VFISSLTTLCNKTIEDTLLTVRNYEAARLEYDAYKTDLDNLQGQQQLQTAPSTSTGGLTNSRRNSMPAVSDPQRVQQITILEHDLTSYRERYEHLKQDVAVKLRFLDENRVKVMRKQLSLFQNATAAYFTGNFRAVEAIMRQFNVNMLPIEAASANPDDGSNKMKSFLEDN
jgi:hypothetical protein